jgi:plasmid stability protein
MATLYVENVPKDLYEALRERAKRNRRSISGEVIVLLELNVATRKSLKSRRELFKTLERIRSRKPPGKAPFPTTEEMLRADRER